MAYYDVIDQQKDVRVYQRNFLLWKQQWDAYTDPPIPLDWQCVKFERNNANLIPTEKGIYAFFIFSLFLAEKSSGKVGLTLHCRSRRRFLTQFLEHGYLIYLGQTGYKSERNLRKRFRDYLSDKKRPKRRRVHLMLNTWEDYLYFYYAEVDPAQMDLKRLEQKLLDTFTPPFVDRGYSAEIGNIIKGLR